ncbi:MAG: ubiquinone biosynthesis protein UbiA [Runella slithyformis]|nr:MAG: ubiquinone biosynthesis protein UbiA [Runella slithyformis]
MKNILLHLRLPFSFFLLPIYLFALSQVLHINTAKAWWVFFILHFLLFPASNAFNSYYDKDEGSIGLLENPPPVSKGLLYTAWLFDLVAIFFGYFFVTNWFSIYLIAYIVVSRAYSHPLVRLKKYPIVSWLLVTLFQGALTYWAVYEAVGGSMDNAQWLPAFICTSNLLAIYPITQVYQHAEDAQRGDLTMSRVLGIRGTFLNALFWLGLSGIAFFVFFQNILHFFLLAGVLSPLMVFFSVWMWRVWQNEKAADFKSTMILNLLASLCLNLFFGILCFL